MWLITQQGGFVSLVEHVADRNMLRARARRREHLAATFPGCKIEDLGAAAPDYRFHCNVSRAAAKAALVDAVDDIDFTSHCKEHFADPDDRVFYGALMDCWRALARLQSTPKAANPSSWGYE